MKEYAPLRETKHERNPKLEPEFNQQVDEWMQNLAGDHYEELKEWIGTALAFEEGPVKALFVEGPPGIGKKLLTEGLRECMSYPSSAYFACDDNRPAKVCGEVEALFCMWNGPVCIKDEAYVNSSRLLLKMLRSEERTQHNRMLEPEFCLENPMRLVFTGNDSEAFDLLAGEGSDNIALRLVLDSGGREHIQSKGGLDLTAAEGSKWIRSDSGEEGNYVVAKHFLWLHANR